MSERRPTQQEIEAVERIVDTQPTNYAEAWREVTGEIPKIVVEDPAWTPTDVLATMEHTDVMDDWRARQMKDA